MSFLKQSDLLIGVAASGVTDSDLAIPDLKTKVRMVKESGVFDFLDRSPPDDEFSDLLRASDEYAVPVLASTWYYTTGRDEPLFERNILKGRLLATEIHAVQLATNHADGHILSDEEVAEIYLRFYDFAHRHDVTMSFEVHVNMWSEHFGRVAAVADLVQRRGVPFALTLDHSHVIFKIDNPAEQRVQGMHAEIQSGTLILEPDRPGNVIQQWIDAGLVWHCHARSTAPCNPVNVSAKHPDGRYGRGIQYPFKPTLSDQWHYPWRAEDLEPWKAVMRNLMRWRTKHLESRWHTITCEFIPAIDYGAGAKYSIFEQNIACAEWLRKEWALAVREPDGSIGSSTLHSHP